MLFNSFLNNNKRIIHKWEHYFPIYERHFSKFINQSLVMIEIGCGQGGSLQMWRQYLGPLATIVGIDINPRCKDFQQPGIFVRIGDQSDKYFLSTVLAEFGIPEIVLDDGSHIMKDINTSFDFLYPLMRRNSIYMVEDLHTAYWKEYGGGIDNQETFTNRVKGFVDLINADHSRGVLKPNEFTRNTFGMSIYDSIVCFEKGCVLNKFAPKYGNSKYKK